jgi:hypothetical protein
VRRWSRRRIAAVVAGGIVAVAIALALSGSARGIALYAYLLFLVLIAVLTIGSRIRRVWPRTQPFERLIPWRPPHDGRVPQLETLSGRLSGGQPNAFDLYHRIRPLVQQVVVARLARGYGIDLETRPERAQRLVGPRTWELIRPDLEPPRDSWGRTWSVDEMEALVTELEQLG